MKRSSTIRTAAATFALILTAGVCAYAQPKLEIVGGDTYDWGRVAPGKLTTVVQVKNIGNAELKISGVQPSCGCTAAPIDKNLLQPQEIGKISITLDVAGRSGPVEKTITISSNDSTAPTRTLRLKADIHRAITITPSPYMMVTDGKIGVESTSSSMTIKNTGDAPIKFDVPAFADGSSNNIKVRFDMKKSKVLKPGEQFELKAYVTPKDANNLYGTVKMKTNSTEMPSIDIMITGTMSQASTAQPAQAAPQASRPAPRK